MRKDDMPVIICKLLAYLYDCMKKGEDPDKDALEHDGVVFGGVSERYRAMIVREVCERGYVTGMKVTRFDNQQVVIMTEPQVTLSGVEYLFENKTMSRVIKALKESGTPLSFVASITDLAVQ